MKRNQWYLPAVSLVILSLAAPFALADSPKTDWTFTFGSGAAPDGATQVQPDQTYNDDKGYGFEPGANVQTVAPKGDEPGAITSDKPYYFSVKLPEGNYNVTLTLGNPDTKTDDTVKAELRRLMLYNVKTEPGHPVTRTITVNVRRPEYPGGKVRLKHPREDTQEAWAWDDKLTLEFNGKNPSVSKIEIQKVDCPTIYILGDSTVCDQSKPPYTSWGQMLTYFFKPGIAISNQAESGETAASSLGAHRLDKVRSEIKHGDYLLFQFGHNDQKEKGANVAYTSYTEQLKRFVKAAKEFGATPVVITSVNRRTFDKEGQITNSLGDFPDAARKVAKDENVPLIDLNAMTKLLYEAIGPKDAWKLFAIPSEHTHHDAFGAFEIAKCVVQGMKDDNLPLTQYIRDDFKGFNPTHPDNPDDFHVPVSPGSTTQKPLGD